MIPPVARRKRDWFVIIRALMRCGVSMAAVARATGRDIGTVRHWQNGGEPKESDARIVLALLAKGDPDEYRRLQAPFDLRVEIEAVTVPGDQRRLSFGEVK